MPTDLSDKNDPKTLVHIEPTSLMGWLALSFTDLWFVGIIILLTAGGLAPKLLGDAGIGWHIRNGEQILQTHTITRIDPFSVTTIEQKWYAWEWLYDIAIAEVHAHGGLNGVVFFTAIVIAATFALALRVALARGATVPITLLLLAFSLAASSIHFLARPHVLSWMFCVVWFSVLDKAATSDDPKQWRQLYWLPPMLLLWANLHGGFLVGLVLLGLYLADALSGYWRSRESAASQRAAAWAVLLARVTGLSFLASLVNPYGLALYSHIYAYLSDRFLMDHIDEFQSPNFHGIAQKCFLILLLMAMVALTANEKKLRPAHWLIVLFAAYSGLYSSRNLPVSSLLLTFIIAPLLSQEIKEATEAASVAQKLRTFLFRLHRFSSRVTMLESRFRGHLWPAFALLFGLWACLHGGTVGARQVIDARFSETRFPVLAVNEIKQSNIREPVFAPDYWGGYLIYRFYPERRVFVDDRHDLYGSKFFQQYLTTIHVEPGWSNLLDSMQVNWVLVPSGSPLANILKEMPSWKITYQDQ